MRIGIFPLSRTPASYRMPARPSMAAIAAILRNEWRVVAAYAFAAVLLGAVYCLITPKLYEASLVIVPSDFTTKPTNTNASGLASILLNTSTESDSVKRFLTVLYSPDLAQRLANKNVDTVLATSSDWLSELLGTAEKRRASTSKHIRTERLRSSLSAITSTPDKETLATKFTYRSISRDAAKRFLGIAMKESDDLLRQYNLAEIRYDADYLNRVIGTTQIVDIRTTLAQKLVETELRRMDAKRAEYFSIRAIGPVEVTDNPVWPQKKLILGGMFVLGTLIGLAAAFTRVYIRSREPDNAGR